MKASEKGHNQLLTEVLRLLHYLVGYGYYANVDDIQRLLKPMLSVMDGRNDEPSPHGFYFPPRSLSLLIYPLYFL